MAGGSEVVGADKIIEVWTDGACRDNQSKDKTKTVGGWGVLLRLGEYERELCGGEIGTTNNRMEMTALINGLTVITDRKQPVVVYSDSKYVIDGITKWLRNWNLNNDSVKNSDLWKRISELIGSFQTISFVKVPGHSGIEGNERADKLANRGADLYKGRVNG